MSKVPDKWTVKHDQTYRIAAPTKADSSELELHKGLGILESSRVKLIDLLCEMSGSNCCYDELCAIANIIKQERAAHEDQLYRQIMDGAPEHYPGCPYITKYVGPEGTPYDGPACDCGVLEWHTHIRTVFKKGGTDE